METSELAVKLAIVLIPGAIGSIIFEKLTVNPKWTPFEFISHSILISGTSYIVAQLVFNLWGQDIGLSNFWLNLPSKDIPFTAVVKASGISILISLVVLVPLDSYKVFNKLGKWLKLTSKYGDENLFSYFLATKDVSEVYVRDIQNNISYHGCIVAYNETKDLVEIVLIDVKVYNYESSDLAYNVDKIYLSRTRSNIIIEVPSNVSTDISSNFNNIGVKSDESESKSKTAKRRNNKRKH